MRHHEAAQSGAQQKCPKIEDQVKKSKSFGGLGGTFGQIAADSAGIADGIQNSSTLGSGTLSEAASLAPRVRWQNEVSMLLKINLMIF